MIVGAGAAGLSLALMLDAATIFEKDDTPGGLCRSTVIDGFTFDTGPHILGGIPEAVRWIVESTGIEFVEGKTRNVGWVDGEYVAHPFVNPDDGYRYMAKMWNADPATLSTAGLGAQKGRKPGGVSTFLYPAKGGYQAITDAWAKRCDVVYNVEVKPMEGMIWTAPVPGRYNRLVTVTMGFEGTPPPYTAIYLPERWTPFHRLSFPSAFSPHNAPAGCYSIQAECSMPMPDHPSRDGFVMPMADTLDRLGLWKHPEFVDFQDHPHAYPVPDGTEGVGHGRTGGRKYLNVDGVVAASMALAAKIG